MSRRWVLVVDDEPAMAQMLLEGLREAGWEGRPAEDAAAALRLLPRHRFDAVVSDIRAGGGGGFLLLESLQRRGDRVPVILMSSFGNRDTARRAREAGAFAYLDKPFTLESLLALLERIGRRC